MRSSEAVIFILGCVTEISALVYMLRWQRHYIRPMFCKCLTVQQRRRKAETRLEHHNPMWLLMLTYCHWPKVILENGCIGKKCQYGLFAFARATKEKFTYFLIKNEILKLKSVKVSFVINVKFLFERNGKTQYMKHYFELKQLKIFSTNDEDQFEIKNLTELLKERRRKERPGQRRDVFSQYKIMLPD